MNIEKPFSREAWEPNVLQSFLELLRDELGPEKRVIWLVTSFAVASSLVSMKFLI